MHAILQHGKMVQRACFTLYGSVLVLLAVFLMVADPHRQGLEIAALVWLGLGSWTVIEYVMHRFVLHGLQPFRRWHMAHHQQPAARIYKTATLSVALIAMLVMFPALLLADRWLSSALTLGLLTGYFGYVITHHAIHHWRNDNTWLNQRKRWHLLYHHHSDQPGCYGVTSGFWDHVFGSARWSPAGRDKV